MKATPSQRQSKPTNQRIFTLFSMESLVVLFAYCLYRTSSFSSYLSSFNLCDSALGYISEIPFLLGASVGIAIISIVIFVLSSSGKLKPYSLNYFIPLTAMALAYLVSAVAPSVVHHDAAPLLFGVIWGLATTAVGIVFLEIFAYETSSLVFIIQLIVGSIAAALFSSLIDQLPKVAATSIHAILPLTVIPLLAYCQKHIPPYTSPPHKFESLKKTLGISSTAILAFCFFELITGLVNMYAYAGSSSFTISANAPIQGMLISAVVVAVFMLITKKVPNQRIVFLFVFPGIIAVFLLLPFFGESMGKPLSTVIYSAYLFTSILSRYWYITTCRKNKTNPYQLSSLVGLSVRFALCIGLALGWIFSGFDDGEAFKNLSILGAVCIYLLGMVIVLWAYRSSQEKQVEIVIQKERETFEQTIASQVDEYVGEYNLTGRERDVLVGLAQGNTAASIAKHLYLSTSTVQGYIKSLYTKLNVNRKQQIIDLFSASDKQRGEE